MQASIVLAIAYLHVRGNRCFQSRDLINVPLFLHFKIAIIIPLWSYKRKLRTVSRYISQTNVIFQLKKYEYLLFKLGFSKARFHILFLFCPFKFPSSFLGQKEENKMYQRIKNLFLFSTIAYI